MKTNTGAGNLAAWMLLGTGLMIGLLAGLFVFVGVPPWMGGAAGAATAVKGTPAPAPVAGAPAPDFTTTDARGQSITLSDLKGQVVLLNFWATWCGPCQLEMPAIQKAYDGLKDKGFTVLAVNLDEPVADVNTFMTTLDLSLPVALDPGAKVNDLYRVRGYPTTFFINRDGVIANEHIGAMSDGQLQDYLAKLGLMN